MRGLWQTLESSRDGCDAQCAPPYAVILESTKKAPSWASTCWRMRQDKGLRQRHACSATAHPRRVWCVLDLYDVQSKRPQWSNSPRGRGLLAVALQEDATHAARSRHAADPPPPLLSPPPLPLHPPTRPPSPPPSVASSRTLLAGAHAPYAFQDSSISSARVTTDGTDRLVAAT